MPVINSSNFSNSGKNGKKKVNPILPLIVMVILAVALIAQSSFVADVNSSMYQKQQDLQSMYDEQNSGQ